MRATLDIDEDVFRAAEAMASVQRISTGQALSELARRALAFSPVATTVRNGVPLLPKRPGELQVSLEIVNRLREHE